MRCEKRLGKEIGKVVFGVDMDELKRPLCTRSQTIRQSMSICLAFSWVEGGRTILGPESPSSIEGYVERHEGQLVGAGTTAKGGEIAAFLVVGRDTYDGCNGAFKVGGTPIRSGSGEGLRVAGIGPIVGT
uniref:Uncharacterized protein n=1 Tax=Cannabis sativa TaxID=3483 RepID=A0A803QQ64_CANSA